MAISIGPQYTVRSYRWTQWKTVKTAKNLIHQYDDDGTVYTIWGYDGPEAHVCTIFKNEVPYNIINEGYSQSQNNSDKSDFETNYLPSANASLAAQYVKGGTDGTKIGNSGDKLKVESSVSTSVSTVQSISKLSYDDMNASNGGVARGTAINTTYTTIYSKNSSGFIFGFTVSFEGNIIGADEFILKFTVDSLVVAEISTVDIGTNAIYAAGSELDALMWGFQVANNNITFKTPGNGGLRYNSTVQIQIKKASGSNKQFRAGVIALTKE